MYTDGACSGNPGAGGYGTILRYKDKTGCGVIMTTHSPIQALKLADRIIMLCDGKTVEDGKPEKLLHNPKTEWGKKFIGMWVL